MTIQVIAVAGAIGTIIPTIVLARSFGCKYALKTALTTGLITAAVTCLTIETLCFFGWLTLESRFESLQIQ